jgi:hypothetical protein
VRGLSYPVGGVDKIRITVAMEKCFAAFATTSYQNMTLKNNKPHLTMQDKFRLISLFARKCDIFVPRVR